MRRVTWVLTCSALALAGAPVRAQQQPLTLDRLLTAFASMPGLTARFREEKRIAMLAVPIVSEGEILFAPPNRMIRRVTSPTPSVALLDGEQLVLESGGRRTEIALSESEVVEGFVDTFRNVLAGDRAALDRTYRATFTNVGDGFRLVLRPRGRALRRFLREIVLEGGPRSIDSMRMVEANGDETVTTFRDVNAAKRWTARELARVFRL